jgi:imidazolonepropionase-like amidohydrolase
LEEIKTILKYCSYIDFETALGWATLNGAKALGWQQKFGTLEVGKTPGLVHISHTENGSITEKSTARRVR